MKFFTLKGKCLCPLNMPRITFPRPLKVMLPPEVLVRSQQPKSIRCSLERPPITPQPPPFLLFSTYWIKKNREMTDCTLRTRFDEKKYEKHQKCMVWVTRQQGNLLRGVDNKTVRRLGILIWLLIFSSQ